MAITVQGPDGASIEFPDDTPHETMEAAMRAHYQPTVPQQPIGLMDKLAHGAADIGYGIGQNLSRMTPDGAVANPETDQQATDYIDQATHNREGGWQARRAASGDTGTEWARGIGAGLATIPFAAAMPEFEAAQGAGALARLGTGLVNNTLQGGSMAALNPVDDTAKGFAGQKAEQVGIGAGLGAGAGALTNRLGALISPKIDPTIKSFMDQGGRPTFGQSIGPKAAKIEDQLTSVPGLGDLIKDSQRQATQSFNKVVYNKVLEPLGETYDGKDVGHAAVRQIGDKLSNAYDALVPNLKLVPDGQLKSDLLSAASAKTTMSDEASSQFDKIVKSVLPPGPLEGQPLKDMESQLTYEIGRFGKSPDPNHQMIADALSNVRGAITDNLARSNPDQAETLHALNSGWANLTRVERAAANSKDGVFTPDGFMQAVKAADQSVRKRAVARGTALMQDTGQLGRDVIGSSYPDSGSAGRILTSGAALGYVSPKALAAGAVASIPYLPGIRNTGFAVSRPAWAPKAAGLLQGAPVGGLLGAGTGGLLNQ